MQFVDIKNDVAFRKIFGNEKKAEIIISFLNAVLELPKGKRIVQVKIENPYQLPEIKDLKSSILDVRVTDERNISYIVEMQVEEPDGFDKRVQYYTAKQYSSQISTGDDYPKLNQVIFVGILDFHFFEDDPHYITRHQTVNLKTGVSSLNDIMYYFIELKKFGKEPNSIHALVDKWIYFIKNAENLEIVPSNVDDVGLRNAYEDANKHSWTKKELDAYHYAQMRKQDEKGKIEKAEKKGFRDGVMREKQKIALKMHKANQSIEEIVELTELSREVVEKMIRES